MNLKCNIEERHKTLLKIFVGWYHVKYPSTQIPLNRCNNRTLHAPARNNIKYELFYLTQVKIKNDKIVLSTSKVL